MKRALAVIAVLACLCACQSTANKYVVNPEVEQIKRETLLGMNGFTGEVTPIREPIQIQYKECPQFHIVMEGFGSDSENGTFQAVFSLFGSVTDNDNLLDWSFNFDKVRMVLPGNKTSSDTEFPEIAGLISFQVKTDPYGSVKSTEIDVSQIAPFAKSADAVENLKRNLRKLVNELITAELIPSLPRKAVATGDQFGKPDPKVLMAKMGELPKELSLEGIDISRTVAGLTTFRGRKHLAVAVKTQTEGNIEGKASLSIRFRGYLLIDIENGLLSSSTLFGSVEARRLDGGRSLYNQEIAGRWKLERTDSESKVETPSY